MFILMVISRRKEEELRVRVWNIKLLKKMSFTGNLKKIGFP